MIQYHFNIVRYSTDSYVQYHMSIITYNIVRAIMISYVGHTILYVKKYATVTYYND
jgi:hypothetical protein